MAEKTKTATSEVVEPKKVTKTKTTLVDAFYAILKWIDMNIIPIVALPILAIGFADSLKTHLTHMNHDQALVVAIAVAALLTVKAHK